MGCTSSTKANQRPERNLQSAPYPTGPSISTPPSPAPVPPVPMNQQNMYSQPHDEFSPQPYVQSPGFPSQQFGSPYQQGSFAPPMFNPTTVIPGGFDAGARFDFSGPSVPPPPPGHMANHAQMAAWQGQNVTVTQRGNDFIAGGSDGGMVIW